MIPSLRGIAYKISTTTGKGVVATIPQDSCYFAKRRSRRTALVGA